MANISVTYSFSNSTTADASQVNQNFTDIINGTSDGTKDFSINALTCAGTATLNGNVTLGNSSADDLTFTGSLASSVPIKTNNSYDIGSATLGLAGVYLGAPSSRSTRIRANQSLSGSHTIILPDGNAANAGYVMKDDGSGNLYWESAMINEIEAIAADNTLGADNQVVFCDTTGSANVTLTIPDAGAAANSGRRIKFIRTGAADTYKVILSPAGGTINGSATYELWVQYQSIELISDGSNWFVIDEFVPEIAFFGTNGVATSVASSLTDIPFATEVYDTAGAFSSTTFTAPMPGIYKMSTELYCAATSNWSAGEFFAIEAAIAGTNYRIYSDEFIAAGTTVVASGGGTIEAAVAAAGTMKIQALQQTGSALTLDGTGTRNFVNIRRVGWSSFGTA